MSDAEVPAEAQGGPSWRRHAPSEPPPPDGPGPVRPRSCDAARRRDRRPPPSNFLDRDGDLYLIAAFVLAAAGGRCAGAVGRRPRTWRVPRWWTHAAGVLLVRTSPASTNRRMWTALVPDAGMPPFVWIGRSINLRTNQRSPGATLALLAPRLVICRSARRHHRSDDHGGSAVRCWTRFTQSWSAGRSQQYLACHTCSTTASLR